MPATVAWPQKTREVQTCVCDSTRWNGFPFRGDDIVIATYAKTGTTWTQQIVGQLVLKGEPGPLYDASPWVDFRPIPLEAVIGQLEAQPHRRFLKTHLPIDALVFSPQAKYVYVVRDGRDVVWSLYNHHAGFTPGAYEMMNNTPGRVGPALEPPNPDIVAYFHEWLDGGALPMGATFWQHVQGWWDARHLPNILLVHFNHLKADLPGEMRRIAAFLGIEVDEARWPQMLEHCSIDYMRNAARDPSHILNDVFTEGATTFFNKGTNGRWKDLLSAADLAAYDKAVKTNLTPACARWMATGDMAS